MSIRELDLCHRSDSPFKRTSPTSRALCAASALIWFLVVAQPAAAATIRLNESGQLIGATGVDVLGTLYDVAFVDGSCAALFTGCDQSTDFTFTTQLSAAIASQALLDQVFTGRFDTDTTLTFGCVYNQWECAAGTPFGLNSPTAPLRPGYVQVSLAYNRSSANTNIDNVVYTEFAPGMDLSNNLFGDYLVYADWTPSASVPEPASALLLAAGVFGAGVRRWRQKRSSFGA